MYDQASELRQLVKDCVATGSRHASLAPLVVVGGGASGVGTTTIALNLAVALSRQGRRAVFVDADLDHGGKTNLGDTQSRASSIDVLEGRCDVHEALLRGPSGIQVLAGNWANNEARDYSAEAQQQFVAELKHLAPHADAVVIDAGSSRTHFARRLWQNASAVLVVTTGEAAAIMNAYAAIKTLARVESPPVLRTLVNRFAEASDAEEIHGRIAAACRRFLGLRASGAGCVAIAAPCKNELQAIFSARTESARTLDRVADVLWAQLQVRETVGGRP
jgi:flagellar biosynthesis protein FlhG